MSENTSRQRWYDVLWHVAELVVIVWGWYGFIGARWLGGALPMGQEYPRNMHSLFFWENVQVCGSCAYWADVMGGYPVFADPFGSFFHPLAMFLTLGYGAVKGSALTVAASFLLIALAAWWLGLLLRLHPIARLWYVGIAMLGGHMGARLELGSVGMPLATAAAWLAFVALYAFVRTPSRWSATASGAALGMLWISGQGYFQLGIALGIPLFGVYTWYYGWWEDNRGAKLLLTIWCGLLSIAIAAPLIVNLVAYNGIFSKDYDLEFSFAQPIERALLNMVVGTFDVAKTTALNPFAFAWAYSTYIGLMSLLLAVVTPFVVKDQFHRRFVWLLGACALLWLFAASGTPQYMVAALGNEALTKTISALRFLVLLDGLATLAVATLAALAIHALLAPTSIPGRLAYARGWVARVLRVDLVALVIVALCLQNLSSVHAFVNNWVYDAPRFSDTQLRIAQAAAATDGATVDPAVEWMHMPLLSEHVNVTNLHMAWQIDGAEFPRAEYTVTQEVKEGMEVVATFPDGWQFVRSIDPEAAYALVYGESGSMTPCSVDVARGGHVTVLCNAPEAGVVRVSEHYLLGWEVATPTGWEPVNAGARWLTADVGAGEQRVELRYSSPGTTAALGMTILGWLAVGGVAIHTSLGWVNRRVASRRAAHS